MAERVMVVEKKRKPIRRMVQVEVGKKKKRIVQVVRNQVKQLKRRQKERRVKMAVVILGKRNQTLGRQEMKKKLNKHQLNLQLSVWKEETRKTRMK